MQWKLIALRKQHNLDRVEMAKVAGTSVSSYAMKERGDTQFKMSEMFRLREYFGLSIEEIFLPTNCINNANSSAKEK